MNTVARIKAKGKNFEIIVNLDEALKIKKGQGDVRTALQIDKIFYDSKKGTISSETDLASCFRVTDLYAVAEKIIKQGEIQLPKEYRDEERGKKMKQVIDFLSKNALDPRTGKPHTEKRIEEALNQAGVNIDNRPVSEQMSSIIEKLRKIIPIKIETKKIKIKVPAALTGQVYGLLNLYKEKEEWLSNGSLSCIVNIPAGLQSEFYDKLNSVTHGSAITEEVKENV